jgi:sugar lactone lactonase YvrE
VSVGLAYDKRHDLLFAAGGPTGGVAVYDARTGATVAAYTLTTAPSFINDVITTRDAAYLTDSVSPVLYKLPIAKDGTVGAPQPIALSGPAGVFVAGFNLNGIEATEDGTRLIVVNSTKGELYSVNPKNGSSITIDLGGQSVAAGDGLWLDGDTIYVVRNQLNLIAVFELNDEEKPTAGTLVDTITSPLFEVPTTMAIKGNLLVAVNAQFGLPQPNPFEVVVLKLRGDHDRD